MFTTPVTQSDIQPAQSDTVRQASAGKSLKKIFHQEDMLEHIEVQPASLSLLMNPIRLSVFQHLFNSPCDHTRSIARNVGYSTTAINWHLGKLLGKGYIETADCNGKKLYWPAKMVLVNDISVVEALRQPYALPILKIISKRGGSVKQNQIVDDMNAIQQNVDVWLRHLVAEGILERAGTRRETRFFIAEHLGKCVASYDSAAKVFSKIAVDSLRADGLMPGNPRLSGSRLTVQVKLPHGARKLVLECNPFAPARRYCHETE